MKQDLDRITVGGLFFNIHAVAERDEQYDRYTEDDLVAVVVIDRRIADAPQGIEDDRQREAEVHALIQKRNGVAGQHCARRTAVESFQFISPLAEGKEERETDHSQKEPVRYGNIRDDTA